MTADRRLATLTLFASVLLHPIMAVLGSLFPWRVELLLKPQSTRYVVH